MATSRWRNPETVVGLLLLLSLVIRFLLTLFRRFNVDEFQHLHAAWMIHLGFQPYVDFWENHAPLLYYLSAPLLALLGDGIHSIFLFRFAHSIAGLAIAMVVYKLARLDYDRSTAILAALVLSFSEIYLQKTIEIRPDQFLVLFWLLSLWFCFRAVDSRRNLRIWAAGVLLGIGFLFSPKALICAVPLVLIILISEWPSPIAILKKQLLFGSGFLVPCILLGLYFYRLGSFDAWVQSTLLENLSYPDIRSPRFLLLPQNLGFLLLGLSGMWMSYRDPSLRNNARFLMIAALVPAAVLVLLMPSQFSQSALTFVPLFAIYAGFAFKKSFAFSGDAFRTKRFLFLSFAILAGLVIPLGALLVRATTADTNRQQVDLVRFILKNTSPEEVIFDGNAAYIFRKQAYFYGSLVEGIRYRYQRGEIPERIPSSLKRNRCRIVLFDDRVSDLPPDDQEFIRANYLQTKRHDIWIAGKVLEAQDISANRAIFRIEIPFIYRIETRTDGKFRIDGKPYSGPGFINAGTHELISDRELRSVRISAEEP